MNNVIKLKEKCVIVGISTDMIDKRGVYGGAFWAWRVNIQRAKKADIVIVVKLGTKGLIVGVIKPKEWHKAPKSKGKNSNPVNRAYFVGSKVNKSPYLKKYVRDELIPKRYPVRYNYVNNKIIII